MRLDISTVYDFRLYMPWLQVTQFTDAPSGLASASSAARKLLSRFNFRDNKSTSPEDSDVSVEADRHAALSPSVNKNGEESDPIIKEESAEDGRPLSVATVVSNSDSSSLKTGTGKESSKTSQGKENKPEGSEPASRDGSVVRKCTRQSEQHQHGGGKESSTSNKPGKPTVKVKPQVATAAANAPQGQHPSSDGSEKTRRELGTPETISSSLSSSSSNPPAGHVSSVIQRMQHQNSQSSQEEPVVTKRAPKPAPTSRLGPIYPHDSLPGPVKPRPSRKTAPSSQHPPRAPRPLSSPNMDEGSDQNLVTLSLPGLTDCSKEELELLRELQQKAAASDYYGLLGVDPEVTTEELARARREKTRVLHPDHFTNDPERQAK